MTKHTPNGLDKPTEVYDPTELDANYTLVTYGARQRVVRHDQPLATVTLQKFRSTHWRQVLDTETGRARRKADIWLDDQEPRLWAFEPGLPETFTDGDGNACFNSCRLPDLGQETTDWLLLRDMLVDELGDARLLDFTAEMITNPGSRAVVVFDIPPGSDGDDLISVYFTLLEGLLGGEHVAATWSGRAPHFLAHRTFKSPTKAAIDHALAPTIKDVGPAGPNYCRTFFVVRHGERIANDPRALIFKVRPSLGWSRDGEAYFHRFNLLNYMVRDPKVLAGVAQDLSKQVANPSQIKGART